MKWRSFIKTGYLLYGYSSDNVQYVNSNGYVNYDWYDNCKAVHPFWYIDWIINLFKFIFKLTLTINFIIKRINNLSING